VVNDIDRPSSFNRRILMAHMPTQEPAEPSRAPHDQAARRSVSAAEWRLLIIAAVLVLAAYAFISQLPRWLGW
jgi:hypothetical protein